MGAPPRHARGSWWPERSQLRHGFREGLCRGDKGSVPHGGGHHQPPPPDVCMCVQVGGVHACTCMLCVLACMDMHTCTFVFLFCMCTHKCMYMSVHMHTSAHLCLLMFIHVHARHVWLHIRGYAHVYVCLCLYVSVSVLRHTEGAHTMSSARNPLSEPTVAELGSAWLVGGTSPGWPNINASPPLHLRVTTPSPLPLSGRLCSLTCSGGDRLAEMEMQNYTGHPPLGPALSR